MNESEGRDEKNDIYVIGSEPALRKLKALLSEQTDIADGEIAKICCLDLFGATEDDLLTAYVMWARKDPSDLSDKEKAITSSPSEQAQLVNVSKAHRRFNSLWQFAKDPENAEFVACTENDLANFNSNYAAWNVCVPGTKIDGSFVFFYNFSQIDFEAAAQRNHVDTMKFFWLLMTKAALNKDLQEHGACVVQNIDGLSLSQLTSMIPKETKGKLDQLTKGASALKMKSFHVLGQSWWMSALFFFMRLFLSAKMKKRIHVHGQEFEKVWSLCDGGAASVPAMMGHNATGHHFDIVLGENVLDGEGEKKRRRKKKKKKDIETPTDDSGTPSETSTSSTPQ